MHGSVLRYIFCIFWPDFLEELLCYIIFPYCEKSEVAHTMSSLDLKRITMSLFYYACSSSFFSHCWPPVAMKLTMSVPNFEKRRCILIIIRSCMTRKYLYGCWVSFLLPSLCIATAVVIPGSRKELPCLPPGKECYFRSSAFSAPHFSVRYAWICPPLIHDRM